MSDRSYRTILGLTLLVALYFELTGLTLFLVIMLFVEGVTNFRLPIIVCSIRKCVEPNGIIFEYSTESANSKCRFDVETERVWRFVVGLLLLLSYVFYEDLWFFQWFLGFAIFGAGLSGVCPVLLAIRWAGFK